ncbi:glycosyltransferase family 2 protein [Bordetella bronchialis]|uniref:glycosyltransferase family 2 protein n=1 Tax=Bordetella bronchialis TaxID=463025 RepID=UPI003CFF073C
MTRASVIIPTKNPGSLFRHVLDSVCAQSTSFEFDVLVVDSGSTDGTVDFVRSYPDPRVRLHEIPPEEFGHGKTRNLAVSMCRAPYAVLITHDALPVHNGWLGAMVGVADSDDAIAGVFGRHLAYPNASPFTKRDLEMHFASFLARPVVWLDDETRYRADPGYRQMLHFFSDNNALIRRSVWERIPYPDVDFAEDQIWAQRVIEAGYKKAYSHDGAVYHSHDYAIVERLQRSFDESYALRRLFGYVLAPTLRHVARSWAGRTVNDLRYAKRERLLRGEWRAVLRAPFDNLMLPLGHYLGARGDALPAVVRRRLSRDRRMMLGLATSSSGAARR